MKQKLLFLMAFMLLGVTVAKADTVINATDMAATYGDGAKPIGASITPVDVSVTLEYSSSNSAIAEVDAGGTVTFKASSKNEVPVITITAKGSGQVVLATKTISVTIAPKDIDLAVAASAVNSKPYDGTTTATLITTAFTLPSGIINGDEVSLNFTGMGASFDTPNVGPNKTVTLNQAFTLQGSRAFCYTLTGATSRPSLKGDITIGTQPADFGLSTTYSKPIADLKLELTPNVKETALSSHIMLNPGVVNVSIASDNKITINFIKTGTTSVRFSTGATTNYNAADVTVSIEVEAPTQPNVLTFPNVATFIYGETGKSMAVSGVKDNATVTYSSSIPEVATINASGILTILRAGNTVITAKSAETLNYAETSNTASVTISPKDVTIAGVSVVPKTYNNTADAELNWANASISGLVSGDNGYVAIDHSAITSIVFDNANAGPNKSVTFTGSATLIAGISGDKSGNYNLTNGNLSNLNLKGTINKANQPANLGLPTIGVTVFVGQEYQLSFDVNNSPTISYPENPAVYEKVTGGKIKFLQTGNRSVTFTAVDKDGNYNQATGTLAFTVKAANDVVFEHTAPQTVEYGTTQALGVTAKYSAIPITSGITYSSNNTNVVTVDGSGNITIKAASGTATITVTVAESQSVHNAGTQNVQITAARRGLTLTAAINNKVYDGNTTATVNGAVTLNTTNVVSPDVVTLSVAPTFTFKDKNIGTGKEIVVSGGSLTGADASKYTFSASGLTANITKADLPTNLGLPTSLSLKYGTPYTFSPSVSEATTFNVTYASGTTTVAKFADATKGNLTLAGVGSTTITINATAKDASTCNYENGAASIVLQVAKGDQVINAPATVNRVLVQGSFALTPTAYDNPTFKYEAINNDAGVIEVNPTTGVITPKKGGTAAVLITALETALYTEKKQSVNIVVTESVVINTQPLSQTICVGDPFTLSVVAAGAVSYQWYKGAASIPGATNATYTVNATTAADGGIYTVRVQGAAGTDPVTSSPATITIGSEVAITAKLADQVVCPGRPAILSVVATGLGLTYQWYREGSPVSGQTASTYTITDVANIGSYRVDVTGAVCGSATTTTVPSNVVQVTTGASIPASPKFFQIPEYLVKKNDDIQIIVGDNASGYSSVTKYTWSYSSDPAAFTTKETTTNRNTFHQTAYTTDGTLTVVLSNACYTETLSKPLKAANVGIENITATGMKVYPNPVISGSTLHIDLGDGNTSAKIYGYNVAGASVMEVTLTAQISTIPVSLKPGIYMMKIVVSGGKTAHHKFIVK
ncbi:MAG: YDG domain-containing protein [Dysgonamonadaceae bacterium]|jgi:hypothetical protein|nr:YDG domain-containing protein [Dysgonamonadaceae bacterium]